MEQNQSLEDFKTKVKQWLAIDEEINKTKIRFQNR